jgi:F0F1-type ATP synthase membrane subunit b/b'
MTPQKSTNPYVTTLAELNRRVDDLREQIRAHASELEQEFIQGRTEIARALGPGRGFLPVALRLRMNKVKPTITWMHLIKRDASGKWYSRQVRRNARGSASEALNKLLTQVAPEYQEFILSIEEKLQRLLPCAHAALELSRWQAQWQARGHVATDQEEPEWLLPEEATHGGV